MFSIRRVSLNAFSARLHVARFATQHSKSSAAGNEENENDPRCNNAHHARPLAATDAHHRAGSPPNAATLKFSAVARLSFENSGALAPAEFLSADQSVAAFDDTNAPENITLTNVTE